MQCNFQKQNFVMESYLMKPTCKIPKCTVHQTCTIFFTDAGICRWMFFCSYFKAHWASVQPSRYLSSEPLFVFSLSFCNLYSSVLYWLYDVTIEQVFINPLLLSLSLRSLKQFFVRNTAELLEAFTTSWTSQDFWELQTKNIWEPKFENQWPRKCVYVEFTLSSPLSLTHIHNVWYK